MDYRKENLDNGYRLVMPDGDAIDFIDKGQGLCAFYDGMGFELEAGTSISYKGGQKYTSDRIYIVYEPYLARNEPSEDEGTEMVDFIYGDLDDGLTLYGIYESIRAWRRKR